MKRFLTAVALIIFLMMVSSMHLFASEDIHVYLDGNTLQLDEQPVITNGRTLAPMRGLFEALGAQVDWEGATQTAIGRRDGITVRIPIGSTNPTINGQVKTIDTQARVIDGRTYIPLRFVGEAFGDTIAWDGPTRSIRITSTIQPEPKQSEVPQIPKEPVYVYDIYPLDEVNRVISIPSEYSTIQAGINVANEGDALLVAPGTYYENINFGGKNIIITSEEGPDGTIINGGFEGSAVVIRNGEGNDAVLHGFTIINGMSGLSKTEQNPRFYPHGGGVSILNASPTISHNIITRNASVDFGGGISIAGESASPLIEDNRITENISHYHGAGISVKDGAKPTIRGNIITENTCETAPGILVASSSGGLIENNYIRNNIPGYDHNPYHMYQYITDDPEYDEYRERWVRHLAFPGGILIVQNSNPAVLNNNIIENDGGGIGVLQESTPHIEGNLVINNSNYKMGAVTGGIMVAQNSRATLVTNTLNGNKGPDIWVDRRNSEIVDGNGMTIELVDKSEEHMVGDNTVTGMVMSWPLERPEPQISNNPRILHVPGDYESIQDAIDSSSDGDTVIVAPGIYNESIVFQGKHITVKSQDPLDESIVSSTVINGGKLSAIDNGQGPIVMFINGEGREAVLDGFTIYNRDRDFFNMSAIYLSGASPTIRNNIITSERGTGVLMNLAYTELYVPEQQKDEGRFTPLLGMETAPLLESNIIQDCNVGGGMWYYYASPELIGNKFINNDGPLSGAVHNWFSSAIIKDNEFISNNGRNGGAIHYENFSVVIIEGNLFKDNVATDLGGAVYIDSPTYGRIDGNVFTGNHARPGSAIAINFNADIEIVNNLIIDNYGWALYTGGSKAQLINNTFANTEQEEGIFVMDGVVEGVNNIFHNSALSAWESEGSSQIIMNNSLFYNSDNRVWPGEGNFFGEPLFVGEGDYQLRSGSPAIDAGVEVNLTRDFRGTQRPLGDGLDIGAYEYVR